MVLPMTKTLQFHKDRRDLIVTNTRIPVMICQQRLMLKVEVTKELLVLNTPKYQDQVLSLTNQHEKVNMKGMKIPLTSRQLTLRNHNIKSEPTKQDSQSALSGLHYHVLLNCWQALAIPVLEIQKVSSMISQDLTTFRLTI